MSDDKANTPFVDSVLEYFEDEICRNDLATVESAIANLEERGFSLFDAVSYMRLTEEINPYIKEEVALVRMAKISAKYPIKK